MGRVIRYLASMLPIALGFRASLYRLSGMRLGAMTTIDRNLQVTRPDMVTIGSRVTISNAVSILGEVTAVHSHLEEAYSIRKTKPVVIEDDAYIGVKATILPGVATVGANAPDRPDGYGRREYPGDCRRARIWRGAGGPGAGHDDPAARG